MTARCIRCQAKLTQPKAGMAACLAMIPSAYNGTFCPATAASNGGSSERSSEGFQPRQERPSFFISELRGVFSKAHFPRLDDPHAVATNRASESEELSPPIGSPLAAAFPLRRQAGMPRCVSAQRHPRWPDPDISSESRRRWRLLPLYRTCFPSHSANRHHCNTVPLF